MSPCIINLYLLLPEDTLYWFTLNEILLKPSELRRCRTSQSKNISWCRRACDGNFFTTANLHTRLEGKNFQTALINTRSVYWMIPLGVSRDCCSKWAHKWESVGSHKNQTSLSCYTGNLPNSITHTKWFIKTIICSIIAGCSSSCNKWLCRFLYWSFQHHSFISKAAVSVTAVSLVNHYQTSTLHIYREKKGRRTPQSPNITGNTFFSVPLEPFVKQW